MRVTLSHIDPVSTDHGYAVDEIPWLAEMCGLPDWPADKEFAFICVRRETPGMPGEVTRSTFLTEDFDYMEELARWGGPRAREGKSLDFALDTNRCRIMRDGWPDEWLLGRPLDLL